ncbi:hypothetical protein D7Z26_15945 [Cohnella endophytica]|uniref:Uncharacterized protein n=1 Tax=Cohnella endophytica TaxID=2419778 RepID=A0A494XRH7_9BACL|nr:hypothetical protein [Cohnella endophytica]RKP53215.1 hypothetical protein D7Z26_15945 [Cohnella endophytica]
MKKAELARERSGGKESAGRTIPRTSLRLALDIGRSLLWSTERPEKRTSGRNVRPSEDERLQAEWYRGGLKARRL